MNLNLYFNKNGENYTSYNRSLLYPYFEGFANENALNMYKEVHKELDSSSLQDTNSFKEKMFTILYYSYQIRQKSINLIKQSHNTTTIKDKENNELLLFNEVTIASDFGSFIMHSKSTLDIFFNFVYKNFGKPARKLKKPKQSDFELFESYVKNHSKDNIKLLQKEIDELKSHIFNLLEKGNKKSFRNILTHLSSVEPYIQCCFSCFKDTEDNILLIDSDVYEYPMVNTVIKITESLTYFLIKSLSIVLESNNSSKIISNDFKIIEENNFINFRDYIDDQSNDYLQITVFNNKGFTLNQEKINREKIL